MREYKMEQRQTAFVGVNLEPEAKRKLVDMAQVQELTLSDFLRQIIAEVTSNTTETKRQVRQVRELDTSAEAVSKARGQFGI